MPNTKKTTKRAPAKRVVKTAPAKAPAPELHECHCGCKCTPLKKTFYLGGMFILGFLVAYFAFCPCHRHHFKHGMPKMHPVFVNDCLDMESIKCPKMTEALATADVDGNGCISVAEFDAVKKSMPRPEGHSGHRPHRM